ncbi:MAG: M14 family zinc carboxypeptidase [Candidatus Latescibacterota bacterium]
MEIRNPSFFAAPGFWPVTWEEVNAYLDGTRAGRVWEIGRSQGGHPIRALGYGLPEPQPRRTTYSGAIAAGHPEDFYDPRQRRRPVLLVFSAIHAAEIEGTAACLNFAHVMETGQDLRGRRWDELRQLAQEMRVVLVPLAQPDGRIRIPVRNLIGASEDDLYYYGQGVFRDGRILRWPECKRTQPVPLAEMEFAGGYYNDAGINIQHDDFFAADMAPETRALIDLVRSEMPDCFLTLHSCGSGPFIIAPENLISPRCQLHQVQLAALVADRHRRDRLRPGGGTHTEASGGFYLHTALHHTCGALPLLFEFPHGLQTKPFTFEEILDVGLSLFEEVMRYGLSCRYGPR